tara:strand:- start:4105 stop:4377 length:273 start_codon:yes stop_codon:yes gene_type:complete
MFKHIKVTTIRPYSTKVRGVWHEGIQCAARGPRNKKIRVSSSMIFPKPLLDSTKQTEEMVKDIYSQLAVKEKEYELFYKGIGEHKLKQSK